MESKVFMVYLPVQPSVIEVRAESVSIEASGVLAFHSTDAQGRPQLVQAFSAAGWLRVEPIG
jgi:hypothetical protein